MVKRWLCCIRGDESGQRSLPLSTFDRYEGAMPIAPLLTATEIPYKKRSICLYLISGNTSILQGWRLTSNGINLSPGKTPKNTEFLSAKAQPLLRIGFHTRFLTRNILLGNTALYFLGAVPQDAC